MTWVDDRPDFAVPDRLTCPSWHWPPEAYLAGHAREELAGQVLGDWSRDVVPQLDVVGDLRAVLDGHGGRAGSARPGQRPFQKT